MRLVDTRTLEVVSKRDDEIPPYAILSHTWGRDDEEVTLQHMQQVSAETRMDPTAFSAHPIAQRPGFTKIQQAAKLALSEKWDYIWVDTCCIDKTSSAELSEAINSMFRYYQEAEVCYAFLSDIGNPSHQDLPTDDEIMGSRWFTRGWTLQELIAPTVVYFYCRNWRLLGTKGPAHTGFASFSESETADAQAREDAFLSLLEEVTGVDKELLDGSLGLNEFGVATRMKWACRRQTTRVEDRAYCLMGIFGVNMPLLYGEGMNAFIRLQEAILLTTDDQSIFAWRCPEDEGRRDELTGLLAKTPAWFKDSGHIKPLPSNVLTNSTPLSVTNVGLRVNMALFTLDDVAPQKHGTRSDPEAFAAVLDCSPYRSADAKDRMIYKPAVLLRWLGGDQYARFDASTLLSIQAKDRIQHIDLASYKEIYVKQKPAMLSLPEIYLDDQQLTAGHTKYSLIRGWAPRAQWNESTRTIRCKKVASSGILGIFCYSIGNRRINILVGVHAAALLLTTGAAKFWCYIQKAGANDENSLQAITPPREHVMATEHSFMGIHARISVGSTKNVKHNNVTLEIRPISIAQYIEPSDKTPRRHLVVRQTLGPEPENAQDQEQHEAYRAIFPLLCGMAVDTTSSFTSTFSRLVPDNLIAEHGFQPTRTTFSPLTMIDGDMLFSLSNTYVEEVSYPPRKIVPQLIRILRPWGSNEKRFIEMLDSSAKCTDAESVRRGQAQHMNSPGQSSDFTLVHYAVISKFYDALERLVTNEYATDHYFHNGNGYLTPLHLACIFGDTRAVKILLKNSEVQWANVLFHFTFDHPLSLAASFVLDHRITELVRLFKKLFSVAYPDCGPHWIRYTRNVLGETCLHRAAAMHNPTAVEAIVSELSAGGVGRDLEGADKQGRTALWHAAAAGSHSCLAALLDHGADANARDLHGVTALHAACRAPFDPARLVAALLARGADPDAYVAVGSPLRDSPAFRLTPCFYAAMHNQPAVLRVLLDCGASTTLDCAQSCVGPLHVAAANGYLECVEVLCAAGFDAQALTPHRLRVVVHKDAEAAEVERRKSLEGWLDEMQKKRGERKGEKKEQSGPVNDKLLRPFGKAKRKGNMFSSGGEGEASEVRLEKVQIGFRKVAPMIRAVTLETFSLGELKTPLELARLGWYEEVELRTPLKLGRMGRYEDVIAVLEKFKG